MKKMLALVVGFLLVGLAFGLAQEKAQEQAQAKTAIKAQGATQQNMVQAKSEYRHRSRTAFVDENGDGINDRAKDADGDGIPNGQDPDWTKPEDGSGYKAQHRTGQSDEAGMTQGRKAGKVTKSSFGKGSFRAGTSGAGRTTGAGVCDGTGPKGTANRKGRG